MFSLENRGAPGLYLLGWLASVMGLAIVAIAILAGPGGVAGLAVTLGGFVLLSLGLVAAAGAQGIQRRLKGQSAYVGPSPFLVFAASLAVTVLAVVVVLGPASALGLDTGSPLAAVLQVLITGLVYVGLIKLLVVSPGALTWAEMGLRRLTATAAAEDLVWGATMAIPVVAVTWIVGAILVLLTQATPDSPLPPAGNSTGFFLNLIAAAVVAPIGEEIFFRGFATTAWRRAIGDNGALIRGAIFFAFVHIITVGGSSFADAAGRALVGFGVRLPVAFALGWVFMRRRSLYASIGLHSGFNAILLILGQLGT